MNEFIQNYQLTIVIIFASILFIAFFKSFWIMFRHLKNIVNYFRIKIFGRSRNDF